MTRNAQRINGNYAEKSMEQRPAATAFAREIWGRSDVERARLSANRTEGKWGPSVSFSVGVSARARGRGGDPGGLAGLDLLMGSKSGAGPFLFPFSFSFSVLIF